MKFRKMPEIFPGQSMWCATEDGYTFVITDDGGCYSASAKLGGIGKRIDIGGGYRAFDLLDKAMAACEQFMRDR